MDGRQKDRSHREKNSQKPSSPNHTSQDPGHNIMAKIARDLQKILESADPRLGSPFKELYYIQEVAKLTGESPSDIWRMVGDGEIRAECAPGHIPRIPREEVAKLLPDKPDEEFQPENTNGPQEL